MSIFSFTSSLLHGYEYQLIYIYQYFTVISSNYVVMDTVYKYLVKDIVSLFYTSSENFCFTVLFYSRNVLPQLDLYTR